MDDTWEDNIHRRMLAGDVIAPAELAEAYLLPLTEWLQEQNAKINDLSLISEAVEDAILQYIKFPGKFDPDKRGLIGYLRMSAQGDLLNLLQKRRSAAKEEVSTDFFVEPDELRNKGLGNDNPVCAELIIREEAVRTEKVLQQLFPAEIDRQIATLVLEEIRETERYAEVLGICDKSVEEQQEIVKRCKDRVKKRLKGLKNG